MAVNTAMYSSFLEMEETLNAHYLEAIVMPLECSAFSARALPTCRNIALSLAPDISAVAPLSVKLFSVVHFDRTLGKSHHSDLQTSKALADLLAPRT